MLMQVGSARASNRGQDIDDDGGATAGFNSRGPRRSGVASVVVAFRRMWQFGMVAVATATMLAVIPASPASAASDCNGGLCISTTHAENPTTTLDTTIEAPYTGVYHIQIRVPHPPYTINTPDGHLETFRLYGSRFGIPAIRRGEFISARLWFHNPDGTYRLVGDPVIQH